MNSSELSQASRAYMEFTQRLLEAVRECRAADHQFAMQPIQPSLN